MNAAHLHIALVHIPVVLIPTATVLLIIALWRGHATIANTALCIFAAATIMCVPAFLLGEGAEELVEHQPGVSEDTIEEHEEAADVSFWLTVAVGSGALLALAFKRSAPMSHPVALKAILVLGTLASGTLTYTAYEGGKIRHPEAYTDTSSAGGEHEGHAGH